MICNKCGTNNDSDREVCAICGARLSENTYSRDDLMKPMNNQNNGTDSNNSLNSGTNNLIKPIENQSNNNLNSSFNTGKNNLPKVKKKTKIIILLFLVLASVGICGYLLFRNVGQESETFSKYSDTPYNPIEEPAWEVMNEVLKAYAEDSSQGVDFGSDKYVICFGTTNDEQCDITDGQIIPGEDIETSYPIVSGKIIIDVANFDFVYCKDLKFESGYSCTTKDGETMDCTLD